MCLWTKLVAIITIQIESRTIYLDILETRIQIKDKNESSCLFLFFFSLKEHVSSVYKLRVAVRLLVLVVDGHSVPGAEAASTRLSCGNARAIFTALLIN